MPVEHIDQLFSAAVDGELSPDQQARFDQHLAECATCASSYASFRHAVQRARALPPAAMPLPVHLPSGPPVAERSTGAAWLARLIARRRLPVGAATGVAALAAAAIVVVGLTRGGAPASSTGPPPTRLNQATGGAATPAGCPAAASTGSAPLAYRVTASDPTRPGQQLLLSASAASAAPGSQLQVLAVLTVPSQALAAPGAAAASAAAIAVTPCLSVSGLPAASIATQNGTPPEAVPQQQGAGAAEAPSGETLMIPPGAASGTVFHVVATIPANYPASNQAPLSVSLAITVQ